MSATLEEKADLLGESTSGSEDYDGRLAQLMGEARRVTISQGQPYILVTVDPQTAQGAIEAWGFQSGKVLEALREILALAEQNNPEL